MKNTEFVDLKFVQNENTIWDIEINEDGDLSFTKGLDTALALTFYTDQRADISEVSTPQYRHGWWGNLFTGQQTDIGSKLWLLYQSVNNRVTLLNGIDYAQKAYQWLIELGYLTNVQVSGTQTRESISLTVQLIKDNNVVTERVFDLWENTIKIANGNQS